MRLSVVVVNWNSARFLEGCLESLHREFKSLPPDDWEIIVLDNSSFDNAVEVANAYPRVSFIQLMKNLGFARANNIGAKLSTGSTILFLNPDTEVLASSVAQLLACSQKVQRAGAIGACLLDSDGTFQESCIQPVPSVMNQLFDLDVVQHARFLRARRLTRALDSAIKVVSVPAVSGACLLIPRNAFEAVGGFSDDYFMYGEDVDLCYRMTRAGYTNYTVMSSYVIHHGGASTSARSELPVQRMRFQNIMMRQSVWKFLRKKSGRVAASLYRGTMLMAALIRLSVLFAVRPRQLNGRGRSYISPLCLSKWKWWFVLQWALGTQSAHGKKDCLS